VEIRPGPDKRQTQLPPSHAITHFVWDGNRLLAETTQKQNQTQHVYLHEPDSFVPLAQVESERDKEDDTPVPDLLTEQHLHEPDAARGQKRPVHLAYPHPAVTQTAAPADGDKSPSRIAILTLF